LRRKTADPIRFELELIFLSLVGFIWIPSSGYLLSMRERLAVLNV
jgi:hypothetical protein